MSRLQGLGRLSETEWHRLQEFLERFEQAWEAGEVADLEPFLPPQGDGLRPVALVEMVKVDLEIRWRRNQALALEYYQAKYSELGELTPELLYEEYRVRTLYGDRPDLGAYLDRFPTCFLDLQRLVAQQPVKPLGEEEALTPAPSRTLVSNPTVVPPLAATVELTGGYKLIKRLGGGGFGEVWKGEAPGGVEVAVKIISRSVTEEEGKRELDALELIKQLRHIFLTKVHAFQVVEDRLYIVMELAEGSLRERLRECTAQGLPGIPPAELLGYFREAAEAIDFLHSRQVQHRDIKPDNILLMGGHAKVADFGLARMMENQRLLTTGCTGTPPYMAPEVWRNHISVHTDQYSLAATYVELRINRRLFPSKDLVGLMNDHLGRKPNLDPIPEGEQQVLHKALAKNPDERYRSCIEFVRALEAFLGPELQKASGGTGRIVGLSNTYSLLEPGYRSQEEVPTLKTMGGVSSPDMATIATRGTLAPPTEGTWQQTAPSQRRRRSPVLFWLSIALPIAGAGFLAWNLREKGRLVETPAANSREAAGRPALKTFEVLLPKGYSAPVGARVVEVGQIGLYDRITADRAGDVIFLLIPPEKEGDEPFYIMEHKVWNELFQRWVAQPGQASEVRPEWRPPNGKLYLDAASHPRWPVTNVTVDEAFRFARWLGGHLPRARQWDRAAGFEVGQGPTRMPFWPGVRPDVAIGQKGTPREVGVAVDDISPYGVRDMAGNGKEWTRDLVADEFNRSIPLSNPGKGDLVQTRGQPFWASSPLTAKNRSTGSRSIEYLSPETGERTAAYDLGFRVVIEPSALR